VTDRFEPKSVANLTSHRYNLRVCYACHYKSHTYYNSLDGMECAVIKSGRRSTSNNNSNNNYCDEASHHSHAIFRKFSKVPEYSAIINQFRREDTMMASTGSANETDNSSFCRSSWRVKCSSDGTSDEKATSSEQCQKVQFRSRVYCRRFSTRTSEKEDRWYSPNEMRNCKLREKHLQTTMGDGDASLWGEDDTESLSFFGLKTAKETKLRRRLVKEAQASVFAEQACQVELCLSEVQDNDLEVVTHLDEKKIAEIYTTYSKKGALVAYMRGMQTARHVQELLNEDECENNVSHQSRASHSISSRGKLRSSLPASHISNKKQPAYYIAMRRR
jgi:hypothetical protein